jgi:hypothetical protein
MEPVDKGTVEIPSKPGLTTRLSVTITAVPLPISIPVELFGFEVVTSVPFITAVSSGVRELVST